MIVTMNSKNPLHLNGRMQIKCHICSKTFGDNWKYKVHMRTHNGIKPFRCCACDYSGTRKMTVRDHIHRKHFELPNPVILLTTIGEDGETRTVELPCPRPEFNCRVCKQAFKDNYNLKQHTRSEHPHVFNFTCNSCHYRDSTHAKLMLHCHDKHPGRNLQELIYKNGKPLNSTKRVPTCEVCGKIFGFKSQLDIHMKKHTGEDTLWCSSCDYSCHTKQALERHVAKCDGTNKWQRGKGAKSKAKDKAAYHSL